MGFFSGVINVSDRIQLMGIAKSKKMVFIGNDTMEGEESVICPYCGFKNIFRRNKSGDPRTVRKCEHFTSIYMKAVPEKLQNINLMPVGEV